MRRTLIAALMLALFLPVCASAAQIAVTPMESGSSRLAVFSVEPDQAPDAPGQEASQSPAALAIGMQIEARFAQQKALAAMGRGPVLQTGSVWQNGKIASMALSWQGEQADGRSGSVSLGLTVDLETGGEILLDQLFSDDDGALAAMEAIIAEDVMDGMSDYMEYADLLPMPTDQYAVGEYGLTVYWPEDRYRYFSGESGSVTFYWYELADYIGEDSPVYALAHPDEPYHSGGIEAACMSGSVSQMLGFDLGELLGNVGQWHDLADPDYTTDALLYPFEKVRGFAVEIPKYAETAEEETPVSAIRASRISFCNLLETGKTTALEAVSLLGDPEREIPYDEDAAFDAMLEPGTSMLYTISGRVLQLHFDGDGVLSCLILRDRMPESLY